VKVYCENCKVNRVESGLCGACLPAVSVGDTVVSFDFADRSLTGERACYVVGVVEDIGRGFSLVENSCDRYKIRIVRQVFGGLECKEGEDYVYPPVNGVQVIGFGGPKVTGGVVLIMRGA